MPLTAHDILMDADAFRRCYPGWPVTSRDLTDYPEALDEQPPEGKPGGTSLQMSALLRADNEEG
jgi:hypothetical protein